MAKILVLYYSMYGHIETLAGAIAEGARKVSGVDVTIKRVPETMPAEAFAKAGGKQTNKRQSLHHTNWPIMMALFSVHRLALATCPGRCGPSSTRLVGYGHRVHCMAKWPAYSPPPGQAEDKNTPSLQPGPLWPITVYHCSNRLWCQRVI